MIDKAICLNDGGWYVHWFNYETDESAVWYAGRAGGQAECVARAEQPPPVTGWSKLDDETRSYSDVVRD